MRLSKYELMEDIGKILVGCGASVLVLWFSEQLAPFIIIFALLVVGFKTSDSSDPYKKALSYVVFIYLFMVGFSWFFSLQSQGFFTFGNVFLEKYFIKFSVPLIKFAKNTPSKDMLKLGAGLIACGGFLFYYRRIKLYIKTA